MSRTVKTANAKFMQILEMLALMANDDYESFEYSANHTRAIAHIYHPCGNRLPDRGGSSKRGTGIFGDH
jgi:hypothetical protein